MNTKYPKIGLYKHNEESYDRVKAAYDSGEKRVAIIQATGTGKTYQALQLILDHPEKKTVFFAPNTSIIEHIISTIENNPELSMEKDFPNLRFMTYQELNQMEDDEIEEMDVDLMIFDEFHHLGAPYWGDKINTLVESHEDAWLFGMSAYSIRRRGTVYERDMALPGGKEIFSDKVVTNYDLVEAMVDGVLPIPTFESTYLDLEKTIDALVRKTFSMNNSELKESLQRELNKIKRLVTISPSIQTLLEQVLDREGKYIYFCPKGWTTLKDEEELEEDEELESTSEDKKTDVRIIDLHVATFENMLDDWHMIPGFDYEIYKTLSSDIDFGKKARSEFYSDTSDRLRVIFNIDQYGEGTHAPEISGVIMARKTGSDIVAYEQIGRALSVSNMHKGTYNSYSLSDLIKIANARGIDIESLINDKLSEEEKKQIAIDRLSAPLIIDLAGNVRFLEELEDNIKDVVEKHRSRGIPVSKAAYDLYTGAFSIVSVQNGKLHDKLDEIKSNFKIDKLSEFIEELNTGNKHTMYYHSRVMFSNGDFYGSYYSSNKETIHNELNTNPKYQIGYDTARHLAWEKEYYADIKNKIHEFLKMLEAGNREILVIKNPYKFENGDLLRVFYSGHRDEIIEALNTDPRYKSFNKARKYIEEYEHFKLVSNKVQYFVDLLNSGNKKVLLYDNGLFFPNGRSMGQYYSMHKEKIHKLIDSDPVKYAAAKAYIEEYEYSIDKKNKDREFIEMLEKGMYEVMSATTNITFSTGAPANRYWSERRNRALVKHLLYETKEYESYDTARRMVETYEYNHDKSNMIHEFIELLNEGHKEVLLVKNDFVFKNGALVSHYYSKCKRKIWDALNNDPRYQEGYERAKKYIEEYEYSKDTKGHLMDNIEEMIELLNTGNAEIFGISYGHRLKSGGLTSKFWIAKREYIISVLESSPRYSQGYETAKALVKEYELKQGDTSKKKLANEIGAPYELIEDIPLTEVFAKKEYLKANKILPYENGVLHEIFNMSSKALEKKYGITLEELVEEYVVVWSR